MSFFEKRKLKKVAINNGIDFDGRYGLTINGLLVYEFGYLLRCYTENELDSFEDRGRIHNFKEKIITAVEQDLINPQTKRIYLSLNQGTTAVYREIGESRGLKSLERTAIVMSERIAGFAESFDNSPIDLGSQDSLPKGYMAGHAFGREYDSENLNQSLFYNDLEKK